VNGVLQQVPVEVGQRVAVGTNLARCSAGEAQGRTQDPRDAGQRRGHGQKAEVDTRNGIIQGRVSRIDPAAKDGP